MQWVLCQFEEWHKGGCAGGENRLCYLCRREFTLKDIRIRVETYDGCCTIWYERSKLKNPTEVICNRVTNQLMGLNIKEVNVSVI